MKNNYKIIAVFLGLIALMFVSFNIVKLFNKNSIENISWIDRSNSELILKDGKINWYKRKYVHDNNYYSGVYKFYKGNEAVEYITNKTNNYKITKERLNKAFNKNEKYNKNSFIVLDIDYDKFIVNKENKLDNKLNAPCIGFIINENNKDYLYLLNLIEGKYYLFTKDTYSY